MYTKGLFRQAAHKEIEMTFKEYQSQFRKRENALSFDLQRAYQQIKEANTRIDELELIAQDKKALEVRLKEQEKRKHWGYLVRTEEKQVTPKAKESASTKKQEEEELRTEIDNLRRELIAK